MATVYPQIVTSSDLLKSLIRLEELIPFLKKQNAKSAAIVNSKLYGVLPFWQLLKNENIHPVIGLSVKVDFSEDQQLPVVLYAETDEGYRNLMKISSAISVKNTQVLPLKWLKGYQQGLLMLIPATDHEWQGNFAEEAIEIGKSIFSPERLYFGVSRPLGQRSDREEWVLKQSDAHGVKVTAMHFSHYLVESDAFAYTAALAIRTGRTLAEIGPSQFDDGLSFIPSKEEWEDWYSDHSEWLMNTEKMLLSCKVNPLGEERHMPKFPLPTGQSATDELQRLCMEGLSERVPHANKDYADRLMYELKIIAQMGYSDYFLIVSDFMKYARRKGILTGPGRGSSASSLVAYTLYITDVDPLKYNLLFERFLNPERVTMPDIDIDFADDRRHEVIHYVAEKYGQHHTAQIITFGTLSAKAAARDSGRIFGFESKDLEQISKMIPNRQSITLKEAYEESDVLKKWISETEVRKKWFTTALSLEGLPRHASTHAAGVVLSPMPLVEVVPVEAGSEDLYLTQWPMQEVEAAGLLKMDFLGLRNLTILEDIRKLIYNESNHWIDFEKIPLNDSRTFDLLKSGDTSGVFQLESDGMRNTLRQIRPTRFEDIVAINALYRPGPMDFIPVYARRKHGEEEVIYAHPDLKPILEETYGVIVYQEQIMQIASRMAGFSMGEADLLRRAVSKKKREILDQERTHFVTNSLKKGYSQKTTQEVYDLIVRFADYGFPKSHAAAYSLISYYMAYLKANFPSHFYSALLTNAIGNPDKLAKLLMEAKEKKIAVLRPSILKSHSNFTVENGAVRFGLSAIKGVSNQFLRKLFEVRKAKGNVWHDIFELAVDLSAENFTRKSLEPLIKAGALDDFHDNRAALLATLDAAIMHAELVRPTNSPDLFSGESFSFGKPKYTETEPIPHMSKLQFEREVLGFYLSDHPAVYIKRRLGNDAVNLADVSLKKNSEYITVAGLITEIKRIRTKKGESMAFVTLQDETGTLSCTFFPKEFAAMNIHLKEWKTAALSGSVEWRNGNPQLIVKKIRS
ncbi:DNA polymerase III subunit alpha [Chungangia koreensis]|uniref:DNA-directed DNA polymerase n=1 Tax=Chungangia koreensis TaxID=752657 RepID=A0ABV8X3T5_9LACT